MPRRDRRRPPTRSARNSRTTSARGIRRPRSAGTPRHWELFDQAFPEATWPTTAPTTRPASKPPRRRRNSGGCPRRLSQKGVTSLVWLVGVIASLAVLGLAVKLGLPVAGLVQGKVP